MQSNKIDPKKEVNDESNSKKVVPKHSTTSLNETSLNPTPNIKVNENAWVEVMEEVPEASKNMEVSRSLVKPTKQPVHNVEVGEKETKNAKSECELDIVKGGNQREEKSKSIDAVELVEETPSKPKINSAKVDNMIIMDKKISNDSDVENVNVKEEANNPIKSNASKKTTKEGESKGKGKSKCRKILDVIDKVGKKCWCPFLVFVVLPLVALAVVTIKPQMSRSGIGGVSTHQFSHVGGSKDGEENSGGGSQQAGNFSTYSHSQTYCTKVYSFTERGLTGRQAAFQQPQVNFSG